MATAKSSSMPPPQKQMVGPDGKVSRYWLDWMENVDRVVVRVERPGEGTGGDIGTDERYVTLDASDENVNANLPSPIGNKNDFIITRVDDNWDNLATITTQDESTIHDETTQYIYPDDTAHVQAMGDVYRFI